MLEIDRIEDVSPWLATPARPPAAFQALDLHDHDGFVQGRFDGCLFLSCRLTIAQSGHLVANGATVLADSDSRPYTEHRARLYTIEELFAGFDPSLPDGYQRSFDAIVYRHWLAAGGNRPASIAESLAQRLHDHSITDALDEAIDGFEPVAIMGGHSLERGDPMYATVARIARNLTRGGVLMLSGGGPGAMEATHLGAWMAHFEDAELDAAIGVLSPRPPGAVPGREYADADWLHRAFAVRRRWPVPAPRQHSIGIPTWAYGHEPPSAFATLVAKYFANSVREDGLLAIATGGVIFTPGSAGTIQEIFQDAAQNHYASFGPAAPMVLFGVDYWTDRYPVWQLLRALAGGRQYADLITITDDEQEAVERIVAGRGA